jgi:hypothetical protein
MIPGAFEQRRAVETTLEQAWPGPARLDHEQRCELLYCDDHASARIHDGQLIWTTQQRPTTPDNVIAFFGQIALQSCSVPHIVLIGNAGLHKGEPMEQKRRQ